MKKERNIIIRLVLCCVICCGILVGGGYYYLSRGTEPVKNDTKSVPYEFAIPDNKGIMLKIGGNLTYIYLNFEEEKLSVIIPPYREYEKEILGYPIDFHLTADYRLLSETVDSLGGIELNGSGEILRYTGVQISDMLRENTDTEDLKRTVITEILKKIGEKGVDSDLLLYIVTNCETDIKVPDCYMWDRYISKLCENGSVIN